MRKNIVLSLLVGVSTILTGCRSGVSTANIPPVEPFNVNRYMGQWYEIARLPHRFEDGLSDVSATYSFQSNGKVKVVNRGRRIATGEPTRIEGSAELGRRSDIGLLRVTFFWPFSGEYRIIMLDPDYQYAMVTSDTTNYLWFLARTPKLKEQTLSALLEQAEIFGFDTTKLIYPEQKEAIQYEKVDSEARP